MDDTEDDSRYPPNESSSRQKIPFLGGSYPTPSNTQYEEEEADEEDDTQLEHEEDRDEEEDQDQEEEEEEQQEQYEEEVEEEEETIPINNNVATNGFPSIHKDNSDLDDDDDSDEDDDDSHDDSGGVKREFSGDDVNSERYRKKRKLKSLIADYEFAPRVAPTTTLTPAAVAPVRNHSAGRNSLTDWTERETFVLLDSWGDRFLRRGKKSLRTEEWQEVAERVSEVSKSARTETQCRNRLDTLKKKYKKEKLGPGNSNWVYFKKMDFLLSQTHQQYHQKQPQQQLQQHHHHQEREKAKPSSAARTGLSYGMDSGEYVFSNPRAAMRDSPGNSESSDGYGSDGLPPKKRKYGRENENESEDRGEEEGGEGSLRLIAKSIHRFSEIYEKIEKSKREQMVEIERMRMEFQRDLEAQKRQIMERGHAEIARIRRGDGDHDDDEELDDVDVSAENGSG